MSKLSKPIVEILKTHRLSLKNLPTVLLRELKCIDDAKKSDFEYTLTNSELKYVNKNVEFVHIKDIVGTTILQLNESLLEYVSTLYNEKYEYGRRSLDNLNRSIEENIISVNSTVDEKPIKVIKIKNKYYVNGDGNHKVFYFLLMYCVELAMCEKNPSWLPMVEKRYNIKMLVSKVSDYKIINKICYSVIKSNNPDIKMEFTPGTDKIGILHIYQQKLEIFSEEQFVDYFSEYLNSLEKNSEKFKFLVYWLLKINYFKEDIVNKINQLDDNNIDLSVQLRKKI